MLLNTNIEATSGTQFNLFSDVNSQQNSQPNNTKGGETKKQKNITKEVIADDNHQTSFLFTEKTKTTEPPTDTSVTANNADDYTHTAGGNARPTPISADFAENIEFNKTLLTEFIEVLLEATPPEHKNPVEAALNALRYANEYRFLSNTELFLEAFVAGLAKLHVPKGIIKLTTPILCEVLPDTMPDSVEKKLNERYIEDSSFDLTFFENPDYKSDYDNFAGKFVANSWLEMLNKAKNGFVKDGSNLRSPQNSEKVLEMHPAAELAATGTHGDLPNNFNEIKIKNAVAPKDAPAEKYSNVIINEIKGDAQKVNIMSIINEKNENSNNNAGNITQNATSDVNSQNDITTPPANNNAENATEIAHNGENNQISNNAPTATKQAKKSKTSNKKPKFEFEYFYNSTYEKIADALDYISSDIGEAEWYKFIDALKNAENTFGGDFKSLADKWSRQASNYESKAFESKWKAKKGDIDYKFIFNEAISHGWQNKPARDENYSFSNNFSSQNSNNFSNQNSNNKKENANNNAVPAEVIKDANETLNKAREFTNNNFELLKNHFYLKHIEIFQNVYVNNYKGKIQLVIPQFDINSIKNNDVSTAKVISLQFIYFKDDGTADKRPLTGGGKHFTYFECCKEAAKEPKDIFFGEGVRTCLAAATALKGEKILIVCCLDAGNLAKVATKFKTLFPAANFGFLADNDIKENGKNVGVEAAFQAAKEITASLFIPNYLSDLPPEKCDFYDVLKHYNENPFGNRNGVEVIKEILKNDCFIQISNQLNNYKMNDYGVVYESDLCKYSKTIKTFLRKDLTAFDIKNGLDVDDAVIKLTANNTSIALADPKFSGIELKYDTFTDRKTIKRLYDNDNDWKEFNPDIDLNAFQCRIEKNVSFKNGFENAKTKKMYENGFRYLFAKNSYDSGHEALKNLPKWDGKVRLKNIVRDYLNDTSDSDIKYSEAWGIMLGLYIISRLNADPTGEGVNCDTIFVLYEPKGKTGKSEFADCLALDEKWKIEINLDETKDENQKKRMRGKTIYKLEELEGLTKRSINSLKSFSTAKTDTIRDLYESHDHEYVRRGIFFGTTNDKVVIQVNEDPVIRRFAIIEVNHSYVKKHGHINNREAGGIKENLPQILAEAKYLYDNNGGDAYVNDFYNKTFYPLLMKGNQKYVTKGGDWNDHFQAWADEVFYKADYEAPGKKVITIALPDGYKPKDLPGLSIKDVIQFCFNEKYSPSSQKMKDCIAVLLANGYIKTEKFKYIDGKWKSGYTNPNYDANKCKEYSKSNENINCEMKDSYTSEEF